MRLSEALRVERGQVIAFVGAGGKTSAIRRLVVELASRTPVIVTTSTKLALHENDIASEHQIIDDAGSLITVLSEWHSDRSMLLTSPRVPDEPKWDGLPLAQLQDVIEFSREKKVVLLIEADGAGGRSLKAPAAHEPVLPHNLDLLVPVVAIDALGERIESERIHRPEALREILDLDPGTNLRNEHIAALLKHPSGGLKSLPVQAILRVLINKVVTDEQLSQAREIAALALEEKRISGVVIGAVQGEDPVREARGRAAAIVLAAGESKRFGANKLLHMWNDKPILEHVLDAVRGSNTEYNVLVLGYDHETILHEVNHEGFEVVHNQAWSDGQSTSVKAGLKVVENDIEAAVYLLGDMPLVDAPLIDQLVDRHAETLAPIVAPHVDGEWGNPVLFDRITFPAFSGLEGDRGGKALFQMFPIEAVQTTTSAQQDVDRPDDVRGLDKN